MEKATFGFRIYKIWQILKCYAGIFRQAQTLNLGRVIHARKINEEIANHDDVCTLCDCYARTSLDKCRNSKLN